MLQIEDLARARDSRTRGRSRHGLLLLSAGLGTAACFLACAESEPVATVEARCGALAAQTFLSPDQIEGETGCVQHTLPSDPGELTLVALTYETSGDGAPRKGQLCGLEGAGQTLLVGGNWRTPEAAPAKLEVGCRDDGFGLCLPSAHEHPALRTAAYRHLATQHLESTEWAPCFRGPVRIEGGARFVPAPRLDKTDTASLPKLGTINARMELISATNLSGARRMLGALESGAHFKEALSTCDDAAIAAYGGYEGSWVVTCPVGPDGLSSSCTTGELDGNVPTEVTSCVEKWFNEELRFPSTDGVRGVLGRISAGARRPK